jgi:hypothetical protein
VDGQLHGQGLHRLQFTRGRLRLTMQSGHQGHGDVWLVDSLRADAASAVPHTPAE